MSDLAEYEVASHFRPYLIYDSREDARRPFEPVVLYRVKSNVRRDRNGQCHERPSQIVLRFALLYRRDSGFTISNICNSEHDGDNQSVPMLVDVSADGKVFTLARVSVGNARWPDEAIEFYGESHPVVYLSAGKHHHYKSTAYDLTNYLGRGIGCSEGVDGLGAQVLAVFESPLSPRGLNHVGEPWAHPGQYFVNDLTMLGFRGENAWDSEPFCGGVRQSCGNSTASMRALWRD